MKMISMAMCLGLAACASPPVAAPIASPVLPALASALARPCTRPVKIPDGLQSSEVDALWAADRAALDDCGQRHAALVAHEAKIADALSASFSK